MAPDGWKDRQMEGRTERQMDRRSGDYIFRLSGSIKNCNEENGYYQYI